MLEDDGLIPDGETEEDLNPPNDPTLVQAVAVAIGTFILTGVVWWWFVR